MNYLTEQKLNTLITLLLEGKASQQQKDSLNSILIENPEAVDHYIDAISMISSLAKADARLLAGFKGNAKGQNNQFDIDTWIELAEVERTGTTVEIEHSKEATSEQYTEVRKTAPSKLSIYTAILSTAAMLLLALYVIIVPAAPPIVASLGYTVDAAWKHPISDKVIGEQLRMGNYYLENGFVQILFGNGAKVVIEGPADFTLDSTSSMELISGKVVANVNRDAAGFYIKTPSAKVLDLGTEFGVNVDLTGESDIHVFDGEVVLYPKNTTNKIPLERGKAKNISTSGKQKDIKLDRYAFVRQDEFTSKVMAMQGDSYHRWLSYSYKLSRDPYLAAYYTFQYTPEQPDKLLNYASSTAGRLNGKLGENDILTTCPTWTEGRWSEKDALQFERSKKQLVKVSADPALSITGPITIAAWVKCPELDKGGQLLSSRTKENINYQIRFAGKIRGQFEGLCFFRYDKFGSGGLALERVVPSGKWDHIAITHDNKVVKYYLNGELVDILPHDFQSQPVAADLLIGAARNNVNDMSYRMFNGIIDEVAILKRVLSQEELLEMFQAGNPE